MQEPTCFRRPAVGRVFTDGCAPSEPHLPIPTPTCNQPWRVTWTSPPSRGHNRTGASARLTPGVGWVSRARGSPRPLAGRELGTRPALQVKLQMRPGSATPGWGVHRARADSQVETEGPFHPMSPVLGSRHGVRTERLWSSDPRSSATSRLVSESPWGNEPR